MQKKKWIALNTQSSWQSWRSQNDALNIYYKIHMNKFSFKKCRILKKKYISRKHDFLYMMWTFTF